MLSLRQYRLGTVAQGGLSSYELSVGAALHRALAEGAGADGGRQRRAAHSRNAAGWGHKPAPGKPVPALCVRRVDVAKLSAHSLKRIDLYVIRWARRKFKRLRRKTKGARDWFDRLRRVIQRSSPIGSSAMETAEHREPYEPRGSRTDLGAPGGKSSG